MEKQTIEDILTSNLSDKTKVQLFTMLHTTPKTAPRAVGKKEVPDFAHFKKHGPPPFEDKMLALIADGKSYRQVALALQKDGYRAKNGGKVTAQTVLQRVSTRRRNGIT